MPTPTRSWRHSTGRMSILAAASMTAVVGYALRNSAPSTFRMRAMASTTFTGGLPLAGRLGDEHGNLARGLGLVLLVRREGGDGQLPQPRPLGLVADLAHAHRLDGREVADLDRGVRAQVVHPHRVRRRAADRAHEDV